jgi:hypothetical protein
VDDFTCAYTYVISDQGQLKNAVATMAMTLRMDVDAGEDGSASTLMDLSMNVTMDIRATGKDVRITYPSFSGYEKLES